MQTKSALCELLGVNGILLLVVLRLSYKKIANPINDPWMSYDLTDNLDMNLVPREKAEGSGEYLIAEYYHAKRLQSLLKVDFFQRSYGRASDTQVSELQQIFYCERRL